MFAQKRSCGALDKSQVPGEVGCRVYLEGQGNLVTMVILSIAGVIIWPKWLIGILAKSAKFP